MTGTDLLALTPLWITAAAAFLIMVSITIKRNFGFVSGFSIFASALALGSTLWVGHTSPRTVGSIFIVDSFGLFFIEVFLAAGLFILLLAWSDVGKFCEEREEFFLLAFLALLGSEVLATSLNFVSFFLGLEILSVSLYALISYPTNRNQSTEAGIKYLVLASTSAAFILFGMAMIYAETGSLDFGEIGTKLAAGESSQALILLGISLLIVGLGFKLAVVPFHMWTPDIYQGATAPVAALIAAVSKGGILAFLLRLFMAIGLNRHPRLVLAFSLLSGASMFSGNWLALRQDNIKRILAYSSIAQFGYVLVAFLASGRLGVEAAMFYLVAYTAAIIAAFGVIALISGREEEAETLDKYRGLFWRRPWLAAVLTGSLLSLAGLPLTAGFLGKFYVAAAGIESSLWILVALLIINSVIGLYYYLRIIVTMIRPIQAEGAAGTEVSFSTGQPWPGRIAVIALIALLVWFGLFPSGIIRVIRTAVGSLGDSAISTSVRRGF